MAVSGIGSTGVDLTALTSALARTNSVQYTGTSSLDIIGGLASGGQDSIDITGIGADSLGLNAAQIGLARAGSGSAGTKAAFDSFAIGKVGAVGTAGASSFEDALLKAIDGVNADQQKTSNLVQQMVVAPDSVNAHDVTIAMAESTLSLNLARTILDRIVRGWKEVINIR